MEKEEEIEERLMDLNNFGEDEDSEEGELKCEIKKLGKYSSSSTSHSVH